MKNIIITIFITTFLISCKTSFDKEQSIPEEAEPVVNLIISTTTDDMELFKTVWTKEIVEFTDEDNYWTNSFPKIKAGAIDEFGSNYSVSDFDFYFHGNSYSGHVGFVFRETMNTGFVIVVKEGDTWKADFPPQ